MLLFNIFFSQEGKLEELSPNRQGRNFQILKIMKLFKDSSFKKYVWLLYKNSIPSVVGN